MKKLFCLITLILALFTNRGNAEIDKEDLREYFKDILLIINFNHPYYSNIEFLREIYSPYFPNIVFYGEETHPEVVHVSHHLGWFVHRTLEDAMRRWPNYRGYICCQDDCLMNFWNFTRLDKDKIWFHQYWTQSLVKSNSSWPWWETPHGHQAINLAYKKLPKKHLSILENNCGYYHVPYSWGDFFYVPGKYREEFLWLSPRFNKPDVFIEIAVPTLLLSLENFEKMEHLSPYWGGTISSIDLATYDTSFDWIHPIKLSSQANRDFIRSILDNFRAQPQTPAKDVPFATQQ